MSTGNGGREKRLGELAERAARGEPLFGPADEPPAASGLTAAAADVVRRLDEERGRRASARGVRPRRAAPRPTPAPAAEVPGPAARALDQAPAARTGAQSGAPGADGAAAHPRVVADPAADAASAARALALCRAAAGRGLPFQVDVCDGPVRARVLVWPLAPPDGPPVVEWGLTPARRALAAAATGEPVSARVLARRAGLRCHSGVRQALADLRRRGLLTRTAGGWCLGGSVRVRLTLVAQSD